MQRLTISLLCLVIATICRTQGQDGKIVEASIVRLKEPDIEKLTATEPNFGTVLDKVELKAITYLSDGLKVKGYLAVPAKAEKLPCVIYNREGNREFGALTDASAARLLGRMASWGYVVVASQYRGNAGGEGKDEFGGKDVNDVLSLLPLLRSLPQADATRVALYGWGRGGAMTYQALARTDQISAAIVGAGLSDAFEAIARRPDLETRVFAELVPDYEQNKKAALEARSAVRWPEKLHKAAPILLLHGTADWRAEPMETIRMASALYEVKHPFRLVLLEGGDHALSEHREEVDRLTRDWLHRYVRDRRPWPSLEPHGK